MRIYLGSNFRQEFSYEFSEDCLTGKNLQKTSSLINVHANVSMNTTTLNDFRCDA